MTWHGSVRTVVEEGFQHLADAWSEAWPARPLFTTQRNRSLERWVRFHYLPDSESVPRSTDEDETVLLRYFAILEALTSTGSVHIVGFGHSWDAEDFTWSFAPYEGGVDVIASSSAERDALVERFPEWLSPLREWEDTDVRDDEG